MNYSQLRWQEIAKEDLIPAVISGDRRDIHALSPAERSNSPKWDISASFDASDSRPIVCIGDDVFDSTMAWLNTYYEEVMPLSTYCRLITYSEFKALLDSASSSRLPSKIWSSVVTGEIIARSGTGDILGDISMTWATLSYTFSASIAFSLYGGGNKLLTIFLDRLKSIHDDDRFGSNDTSIDSFSQIWRICHEATCEPLKPRDAIGHALWYTKKDKNQSCFGDLKQRALLEKIINLPEFSSDSLETRLSGFDRSIELLKKESSPSDIYAFGSAASAFLVGRGTSHVHLIGSSPNKLSFLWLSVFAGLCGEATWDAAWLGVTRRIESALRFYTLKTATGGPLSDLSWCEFNWIKRGKGGIESLRSMIKLAPNLITTEIIPGVPVQVRVSKANREGPPPATKQNSNQDFEVLANRLEDIVKELRAGKAPPPNKKEIPKGQEELNLNVKTEVKARKPRKRI